MKVTVRMDDITPDMDWESFEAFERMFCSYGIRPLLGIVPDHRDPKLSVDPPRPDFWEKMRSLQKQGWSLAMHGCHHVYQTGKSGQFPLNSESEFAGKSYGEQYRLLEEGKKKLEEKGIVTDIFMAPGHTFDKNTVKALRELGFSRITDGFGSGPYLRDGMTFFPIAFLRRLAFSDREGITTLVIHPNHSTKGELDNYRALFERQRHRFVDYGAFERAQVCRQGPCARAMEYLLATGKRLAARGKRFAFRGRGGKG
ncbi:MAG: DUF2334 domain-containing protein [Eubacteriales bacterium]|nr:DUF2334 domain-containing protein [Eubacteriales bacterium]